MSNIISCRGFEARGLQDDEVESLVSWMSPSKNELFLVSSRFVHPLTKGSFFAYMRANRGDKHRFYSVYDTETGIHAGHFEIKNIDTHHRNGTGAHIVLSPDFRGKGRGVDLLFLLSKVGFEALSLHRIGLSVHTTNRKAVAAYVGAGYSFEGIIREVLVSGNGEERSSLYQMSILAPEWKKLSAES